MSVVGRPPDAWSGPYVGRRPFTEADRKFFFGREDEARAVAHAWLTNRLTILSGASGAGKTSLLRAGVVPALASEPANVLPVGRVSHGSTFPMAAVPEQNPYTLALLASWWPQQTLTRVSMLSIARFLHHRQLTDRYGRRLPMLVAIDQTERLFHAADSRHRVRFLEELREAIEDRPRIHLLMAVRENHLDEVMRVTEELAPERGDPYVLRPFDRRRARAAVTGPLEATGRTFDPDVAARLVDDLAAGPAASARGRFAESSAVTADESEALVEPVLLQAVCRRMWEDLADDTAVVSAGLLPDSDRALADFSRQTLSAVASDHGVRPDELSTWLRNLLSGAGPARLSLSDSVIRAMEDQHLIKRRAGARSYELQHPRLIEPIWRLGEERWTVRRPEPAGLLRAAEVALSTDEPDLAEQHVKQAVRAYGAGDMRERAEAESFLGNVALQRGQLEAATQHYSAAAVMYETLQANENVGWMLAAVGMLKLDLGDRGAAVENLKAAVRRIPNDAMLQTELGQALWIAGQPQTALAVLGSVLTREGDTAEALRARGEILADLGDAESALRDLDRIERRPRPSTRAARALALATLSRVEAARQELKEIDAEATDDGSVLFRVARVQRLTGDVGAATELASRAVKASDPPLPPHQKAAALRLLSEM
ncbi:tetratricopeptide repeat protein [Actinomadura sp. 6N118]|uniref:nSTAND1 domain-containing NTPase n=1 Tax=Actinomadura sp. 6N118 TaxID=3375151 RepID=UPI00379D66FD